jgi:hypothetical protein
VVDRRTARKPPADRGFPRGKGKRRTAHSIPRHDDGDAPHTPFCGHTLRTEYRVRKRERPYTHTADADAFRVTYYHCHRHHHHGSSSSSAAWIAAQHQRRLLFFCPREPLAAAAVVITPSTTTGRVRQEVCSGTGFVARAVSTRTWSSTTGWTWRKEEGRERAPSRRLVSRRERDETRRAAGCSSSSSTARLREKRAPYACVLAFSYFFVLSGKWREARPRLFFSSRASRRPSGTSSVRREPPPPHHPPSPHGAGALFSVTRAQRTPHGPRTRATTTPPRRVREGGASFGRKQTPGRAHPIHT